MAPEVKLVGFEPLGSPSMYNSLQSNQPVILDALETFVDGASMKRTGRIPFVMMLLLRIFSVSSSRRFTLSTKDWLPKLC